MTSASNRLYRGECNGDAGAALQAIRDEYLFEAQQARRFDVNQDGFAERMEADAKRYDSYSARLRKAYSEAEDKLANEIEAEHPEDQAIADALRTGNFEGCAI